MGAVFSFIGATPRSERLSIAIEKDARDFIERRLITGKYHHSKEKRQPPLLETARSVAFAEGDVRRNFKKRMPSVVGEGSMAVQLVHEYLERLLNSL